MEAPLVANNNPQAAGSLASHKVLFGEFSRYAVYAVHTRFDRVQWMVSDSERECPAGLPEVIRQEDSFSDAVAGLS